MRYLKVEISNISNPEPELIEIAYWLLEVDDRGKPVREIAMSADDAPLSAAHGRWGVWCDSACLLLGPEWEEISSLVFRAGWSAVHADADPSR